MFSSAWKVRLGLCMLFTLMAASSYIGLHFWIDESVRWLEVKPPENGRNVEISIQRVLVFSINTFLAAANLIALFELLFGELNKKSEIGHIKGNLAVGLMVVSIFTSLTAASMVFTFDIVFGF